MMDRRSWRVNVAACVLLVVGLLLALAVFSHDPADLAEGVYPLHPTPHNLLGLPVRWQLVPLWTVWEQPSMFFWPPGWPGVAAILASRLADLGSAFARLVAVDADRGSPG